MKKRSVLLRIALIVLASIFGLVAVVAGTMWTISYQVPNKEILLNEGQFNPSNSAEFNSESLVIMRRDNHLAVYNNGIPILGEDHSAQEYLKIIQGLYIYPWIIGDYTYRSVTQHSLDDITFHDGYNSDYYAYSMHTGEKNFLFNGDIARSFNPIVTQDGTIYIPHANYESFYRVRDGKVCDPVNRILLYQSDKLSCYLEGKNLVCYNAENEVDEFTEKIDRQWYSSYNVYQYKSGILIHDPESYSDDWSLQYINFEKEEVIQVGFGPGSIYSKLNVYGDNAYFSLLRSDGDICTYETDLLRGTYKINLTDFSMKKISDTYYSQLYVFDDASIFAVERWNVYQLDTDGNVVAEVATVPMNILNNIELVNLSWLDFLLGVHKMECAQILEKRDI